VTLHEQNFAALLKKAQAGDHRAFDAIYDQFADALFRYIYVRCGDRSLAEDLTSDLWVRIVEHLSSFRPPPGDPRPAFAAWLYRIARNLVIDSQRRTRDDHVPISEHVAAREVPPDEQVIARDDERAMQDALAQITPDQREVILLRFFEECTSAEVARRTGRSEGAVKVMQHRALGALARLLGIRRGGDA
jgi:RNA polymerase sigma-70 factor (ECF subfamily)